MKWFKHFSDSLDDPFIHALMDEFSHFGYAVWFGLIEIIAKENGNTITGKLSISPTYLRRKLRSTPTKLRQVFDFCQTNARLTVSYSEKIWEFDFPKMANIKDNYTKDLQETCKKPSNYKEVEEEKEVDKKKKEKIQIPDWIPRDSWNAFVEMRKKMKAPLTDYAMYLAFNKLLRFKNDGHDPTEILNEAVMRGWKGLFPVKPGGGNERSTGSNRQDTKAGGIQPPTDKYAGVGKDYSEKP